MKKIEELKLAQAQIERIKNKKNISENIRILIDIPVMKNILKKMQVISIVDELDKLEYIIGETLENELEKKRFLKLVNENNIYNIEQIDVEYDRESPYDFDSFVIKIEKQEIEFKNIKLNKKLIPELKELIVLVNTLKSSPVSDDGNIVEIKNQIQQIYQSIKKDFNGEKKESKIKKIFKNLIK